MLSCTPRVGRREGIPLIPLQLLPTTYFGSRQALEGKDRTRIRGRQVGSKLHPCGVRSEPQTCGRGKDSPVSREFQGVPVGQGGQCHPARTTGSSGHCTGHPPALHPSTAQPHILLQPSPFPRWILYGKTRNSPQVLISVPNIPLHPALTCLPLGPGLPGTPWGPGLPWKRDRMSHRVTRDQGEGKEQNLSHTLKPSSPCWPRSPLLPFSP